jgi:hypothetical protein
MVETRQVEPQLQALFTGLSMVGRGEGLMTGGWPAASKKNKNKKRPTAYLPLDSSLGVLCMCCMVTSSLFCDNKYFFFF